jgi:penicillin V acylase-like amidase (Ntn superfamily)
MIYGLLSLSALLLAGVGDACSDFMMNFTNPELRISARTMDLGSNGNWTITSWPAGGEYLSEHEDDRFSFRWTSKYNTIGITGNWFGDDRYGFPSLFGNLRMINLFSHNFTTY